MQQEALGFIQIDGLAAAYVVADSGLKAAGVRLVDFERVQGGGLMLIRFAGDVSGIHVAVEVGLRTAKTIGAQAIGHVIARPAWMIGASEIIEKTKRKERGKKNE